MKRDISHSSVERIILPDSTILLDYMLARLTKVISTLVVYPKHMTKTLNQTGGLIYSQRLLLALIQKGAIRKVAYEQVQKHAMKAWKSQANFQGLIEQDSFIRKHLSAKEIASCFNPQSYVRHQQQIFRARLWQSGKNGKVRVSKTKRAGKVSRKG